jgi:hypothetical protein
MKSFHQIVAELAALITEDTDYRGEHEAPGPGSGAPLHNVSPSVYPEDFHSSNGARYYGDGSSYDHESHHAIARVKDRPNASVKIYRAVPHEPTHTERLAHAEKAAAHFMKTGVLKPTEPHVKNYDDLHAHITHLTDTMPEKETKPKLKINKGDWVTVSRQYAKDHGEQSLKGKYKILSKTVKAKEVYTNGDSIHEQGYHPEEK